MKHRPIKVLVDALRRLGADIRYEGKEGFPPLRIKGNTLEGGTLEVAGNISSQFISALLLIVAVLFPMTSTEFDLVQKEVARRKGEDSSVTTEEEKKMLKKVTGFSYDRLWSKDNAGLKK